MQIGMHTNVSQDRLCSILTRQLVNTGGHYTVLLILMHRVSLLSIRYIYTDTVYQNMFSYCTHTVSYWDSHVFYILYLYKHIETVRFVICIKHIYIVFNLQIYTLLTAWILTLEQLVNTTLTLNLYTVPAPFYMHTMKGLCYQEKVQFYNFYTCWPHHSCILISIMSMRVCYSLVKYDHIQYTEYILYNPIFTIYTIHLHVHVREWTQVVYGI